MQLITRVALILLSAGAVAGSAFLWLGAPTLARVHRQNEIARFAPTLGHGIGQFAGETFLLALVVYVGRRWLRVRL